MQKLLNDFSAIMETVSTFIDTYTVFSVVFFSPLLQPVVFSDGSNLAHTITSFQALINVEVNCSI